jgi:DNA-binding transcriptional LysR family regulator
MELRHIRYFVAVAEELNFRRAAERIHVSQPSLSAQIRQLEKEIGAKLLNRNTHQVSLTAAGHYFLESCRQILRDSEDAIHTTHRISTGRIGHLSIGFVGSLGNDLLPRILRVFHGKFPEVKLNLLEMDTSEQIKQLNARALDAGLMGLGLPASTPDLQLTLIDEEPLMAVLPENHRLLQKNPASLPVSALAEEYFYLAERESAPLYNPWIFVLCQQAGFTPRIIQEKGRHAAVLCYIAAGLGVTILPAQFAGTAVTGVRFIPLKPPAPAYRYYLAWPSKNPPVALAQFVKTAKAVAKGNA